MLGGVVGLPKMKTTFKAYAVRIKLPAICIARIGLGSELRRLTRRGSCLQVSADTGKLALVDPFWRNQPQVRNFALVQLKSSNRVAIGVLTDCDHDLANGVM